MATLSSVLPAKPEAKKTPPRLDPRETFEAAEVRSEAVGYFTADPEITHQAVHLGSIDFNSPQSEATFEVKDNASTTFATSNNPAFDSWAQMITRSANAAASFVESGKDVVTAGTDLVVKDILGLGEKKEPKTDQVKPDGDQKSEVIAFQRQRMHMFEGEKARAQVARQEEMMKLALRMEDAGTPQDPEEVVASDLALNTTLRKELMQHPYHIHARRTARIAHKRQAEKTKKSQDVAQTSGAKGIKIGLFEGGHGGSKGGVNLTSTGGGAG